MQMFAPRLLDILSVSVFIFLVCPAGVFVSLVDIVRQKPAKCSLLHSEITRYDPLAETKTL